MAWRGARRGDDRPWRPDAARGRSLLRRRRAGSRAGADRARSRGSRPCDRGCRRRRCGGAGGVRWISAPRAVLPWPQRRGDGGGRRAAAVHRGGRAEDDRRRAARERARAGCRADDGRVREPCRPDDPRRRRRAARPGRLGIRERRGIGLRGLPRRPGPRNVSPRPAAPAEPLARRLASRPGAESPDGRGADPRAARRTSSRTRRTRSPQRAPAPAAAVTDTPPADVSRSLRLARAFLRAPTGRRDTRSDRPAASAPGSAGSAGGARPRRARRSRTGDGRGRRRPARSPARATYRTGRRRR